jgi:hypothetical protein
VPDGEQCQPDEMPVTMGRAAWGEKRSRLSMPALPKSTGLPTRWRIMSQLPQQAELADVTDLLDRLQSTLGDH